MADIMLTRRNLSKCKVENVVHVVHDGVEALEFLRHDDKAAHPRPSLILMDLNMPRMGGEETLAEIKADEDLMMIPVIILTTSARQDDIVNSYRLHANSYITKPSTPGEFTDFIKTLEHFWFQIVRLPAYNL